MIQLLKKLFAPRPRKAKKINLEYAVSWDSISRQDFREICRILSLPNIGRERALFLCLCALAHIRPDDPSKYDPKAIRGKMPLIVNGETYFIGSKAIAEACDDISFIYDSTNGVPPCPLERVDRHLYDVPFDVFYTADSFILRYAAEGSQNNTYLKEAAKQLTGGRKRKLEPWERTALIIWWNAVKLKLADRYPYVLKSSGTVTDRSQAEILQDILASLNQNRPQENEKILKADTHSVLTALNNVYRDADKKLSK